MSAAGLGSENETTEFKKSLAQLDKGILSLTAMINRRNGGTVYFGVDDDGTVIGVKPGPDSPEKVRNRIRTYVQPQVLADIQVLETPDGLKYIRVSAEGHDTPYSFDGRYYVRNVTSDEQASPAIVRRMMTGGNSDIMRGIRSPVRDLSFTSYITYMEAKNLHPRMTRDYFDGLGMLTGSGDCNLVAYLMSDQNGVPMQVVRFGGTTKSSMSERTDHGHRCLLLTVRSVIDSIASLNETRVDLGRGERRETELFDAEAFRESWINACAHNDWKDMLPPSVFVFDDRIEVQSYGGIPFSLSEDEFYSGKSMPVNRALFGILTMADYSEQSGHGIPTIVERYGREAISVGETMVTVTIPFAFRPRWASAVRRDTGRLTERHMAAVEYLERHPSASIKDLSGELDIGVSTSGKIISELKIEGYLENRGNNRRNVWVRLK